MGIAGAEQNRESDFRFGSEFDVGWKTKNYFRQIMDRQLVLLVHLPKGTIGEGASALMGAFIVAHIQKAALARARFVVSQHFLFVFG